MKKKKLLVAFSILLILFMMAGALNAALWCFDLKNCSGAAGCYLGGNPDGCIITCLGGGKATCDEIAP
jgi:hypothetical protein